MVHWMARDTQTPAVGSYEVHLLPGFDEFVLGYKDRTSILAEKYAPLIVPGNNGVFRPTVVVGGQIAGTWKRVVKKGVIEVEATPFTRFSASTRSQIERLAARYQEFFTHSDEA